MSYIMHLPNTQIPMNKYFCTCTKTIKSPIPNNKIT